LTELEPELTDLLQHALAIGKILKKNCGKTIGGVSIEIGGFHSPNHSLSKNQTVVEISTNTIREMQATTTTTQGTLNEINCRLRSRLGVVYDKTNYNDIYYEEKV
jgi:hypothetical protein